MMKTSKNCPRCGVELENNAVDGLCPKCLMNQGMATLTKTVTGSVAVEPVETQTINPALGTSIRYFGDYELLEEIARGGMGVIYKAKQKSLNRIVGLKMILSGQLASEAEVKRFHVEAEAAANLQHPNIVAIHEVGVYEGRHYFTMDYVDGKDLAKVANKQPMSADRAVKYVKTIAEAVHFAHQRGTLHRDIKPQNVLIDKNDHVRITDFGLAKQVNQDSGLTQSGAIMGSPSYMSPEQAQGRQDLVGPSSDVYSIGAILYELLTGRAPFSGDSAMKTVMNVIEKDPVAPRKIIEGIPVDLETICMKCLEKQPERRYASGRALAEELDRFLRNEPILARPASTFRKTVNWMRHHPAFLAGVAALAMFGMAYGLFYLGQDNAFLRAQQANPGLKRETGALAKMPAASLSVLNHVSIEGLTNFNLLLMFTCIYCVFFFIKRARRQTWQDMFDPAKATPLHSVGPRWRITLVSLGLVMLICSGLTLAKLIQAHVWEGRGVISDSLFLYCIIYWGVFMIHAAWKDHQRAVFGVTYRQLDPATVEAIRDAVLKRELAEAMEAYSKAAPESDKQEAWQYVLRVMNDLREKEPEKWAEAERKYNPWDLNLWYMMVAGFVEGAVGMALLMTYEPGQIVTVIWKFIEGFVLGAGIMMLSRLKGVWRWIFILCVLPLGCGLLTTIAEYFIGPANPPLAQTKGIYFTGVIFAVVTMLSGFTKPKKMPRWVKWGAVVAVIMTLIYLIAIEPGMKEDKYTKVYTFTEELRDTVKAFSTSDKPIDENVVVDGEGWSVDCHQPQTYRLFEVPNPGVGTGMVSFSASMISQNLKGRVYVEMIYRMPDGTEHSVKDVQDAMSVTNKLSGSKARHVFKEGEKPDLFKLNLVVEGRGKISFKYVEFSKVTILKENKVRM